MCEYGNSVELEVTITAELSCTGERRKAIKQIDSCIAPIIKALNDGGIITTGCCCGHGERDGSILLEDGRELKIVYPS